MNVPQEVLDRLVFSVGEQDYRWADVIAAARVWGRWDELEDEAGPRSPESKEGLEEAGQAFRYARNLLAAEEMEAWLEHWGLSVSEWHSWLRGEADVWPRAVCSGALADFARDLAAGAAAAEADGEAAGPVDTDLERMDQALAALRTRAVTGDDRGRLLESRRSDWVRVQYSALAFTEPEVAREAVLCVREDGLSLSEVAERAGVEVREVEDLVENIDPKLAKSLLSAPAGELVGPLEADGLLLVAHVQDKIAPTLADPLIQDLIEREVPRRAVEREVRNRVRWHERL